LLADVVSQHFSQGGVDKGEENEQAARRELRDRRPQAAKV
jgi:hypothetical protein